MKNKQPENPYSINTNYAKDEAKQNSIHLKDVIHDEDFGESFSQKLRFFMIKLLFCVLFGLIVMGIGLLVGYLIAKNFGYGLQDTLFITGIILTILGIFASMKGNPVSANIVGMGMKNSTALNYMETEAVRLERERTNYYQDFFKHAVVKFAVSGLAILLGGVFTIIVSILFF